VDPRTGLDDVEKKIFLTLPGLEFRPLHLQVPSQSLYRLSYPGSYEVMVNFIIWRNNLFTFTGKGFNSDEF
jgi:hypothetical protein